MYPDPDAEDCWSDEERARRVGVAVDAILREIPERVEVHAYAMGVSPERVHEALKRTVL